MKIIFYKTLSPSNKIEKDLSGESLEMIGALKSNITNILYPNILIRGFEISKFNYAFIEEFGRYYFIDGASVLSKELVELSLKVDVLMTYKDDLQNVYGDVSETNEISNDVSIDTLDETETREIAFDNPFLSIDNSRVVMVALNGGALNG